MRNSFVPGKIRRGVLLLGLSSLLAGWITADSKVQEKTAEQVYQNIQIFKGAPASEVMGAMVSISGYLGVDCDHCHVMPEFEKEDRPAKEQSRKMFRMVRTINRELNSDKVTCYTCHRGKARPEVLDPRIETEHDKGPRASEVFKNVHVLKSVSAGRLSLMMADFTSALGVDCTYCHFPDGFDKENKPAKDTARRMLNMSAVIEKGYFGGKSPVSCATCHRREKQPPSNASGQSQKKS